MNIENVLFIYIGMKKLAIVGATGLVGQTVLRVLKDEGLIDYFDICLLVSSRSAGKVMVFDDKHFPLFELNEKMCDMKFDYAIFVLSEDISLKWVNKFAENGTICIDNSSAFRMKKGIPLVVPEINIKSIKRDDKIISNPNCSTIQLVLVLDRLMRIGKIEEVVVSSYQSVSGAGKEALLDLENSSNNYFKCGIKNNIIAQIGSIENNGNCTEENKIINETNKILNSKINVYATTVRVPISNCHGESVLVKFKNRINISKIKNTLDCDYIHFSEDLVYPVDCAGSDLTYVFRLRQVGAKCLQFFVIADNLRRGAGYNAVKILKNLVTTKDRYS